MATTFTNQATLSYNGATVRSNLAVGVMEGTLSVTKNAVAGSYGAGDAVAYAVSIVNNSDAAVSGLTVSDDLGAYAFGAGTVQPLTYLDGTLQYYANGVLQPAPAVATADGLVISGISVPAGGSAILIYSAAVNSYAPLASGSAITNTVTVSGAGVSTVEAQDTVPVTEAAQLSVLKSVTPIPVAENGRLTYTFQLQNAGNAPVEEAAGAVVSDVFSPPLTDISVALDGVPLTAAGYSYDEATGVFATASGVIGIPAATYTQEPSTGEWSTAPGSSTLTVTGTVAAV